MQENENEEKKNMSVSLTIDFSEHQIHGTDNGNSIGQQVTSSNVVKGTQVSKTRSSDLTSVWSLRAIRHDVNSHLTLRSLNGSVGLTLRNSVTLGEQQEVVDQGLHILLHRGSWRWRDLVVLNLDWALRHIVDTLFNDSQGLSELSHSTQVTVVTVTVVTNSHIEVHELVSIVWLSLSDIIWDTGASKHNTRQGVVQSIIGGNNTNINSSVLPDTVVSTQLFGLIDSVTELGGPHVDIVQQASWQVLGNTTWSDVGSVQSSTGNTFVELHQLLSLLETPQERSQTTHIHNVGQHRHTVVQHTGDLTKQGTDILGSQRNLNIKKLLHSKREHQLVGHHGDVVQTVKVGQSLHVCLGFNQFLGTTMKQTNVRVRTDNLLTLQLQNQTQHTVCGWMLWTEVDGEVSDLGVLLVDQVGVVVVTPRHVHLVHRLCERCFVEDQAVVGDFLGDLTHGTLPGFVGIFRGAGTQSGGRREVSGRRSRGSHGGFGQGSEGEHCGWGWWECLC
ncbi:hypothetical protein PUMCH_001193 [Australozyma saopauloensis]|uniref:Uncharacterized protein n=1 Tax=Australozyma saopauloensis TaxID=291208 RepID=A0AAX4H657_9ASCO|nr:hypothetical protein PUMCH_001193 [[Candida] saopauloensis]